MAEKYVSIKVILNRLLRHPLLQDITYETVVDCAVDFMRIVGVPQIFQTKIVPIEVSNYRGQLPCDLYQINQIKTSNGKFLRYTSDTFHLSPEIEKQQDGTYMTQGELIYTSFKEDTLSLSYNAFMTDEDGVPMIPENSVFYRALEAYVKKFWFTILFDMGKIQGASLQLAQTEYAWAVGACETEFLRLDLGKAESFFNSFRTLIIRDREFSHGFRENSQKEIIR